jgi:hypothetical protein
MANVENPQLNPSCHYNGKGRHALRGSTGSNGLSTTSRF